MRPPALPLKPGFESWAVTLVGGPPGAVLAGRGQELLDTARVAGVLGVSSSRVYQIVKTGALTPIKKIGALYLFLRDDVERLADSRQ
jgi:hypothetical protein